MNQDPQGEAATPPPVPLDYTHAPETRAQRSWPILLAQAMRKGTWVIAQVQLVGAVECRVPSPSTVLRVGDRWQVTDSGMRVARAALTDADREQVMNYLLREDVVVKVEVEGREQYRAHAPALLADELAAFTRLWTQLRQSRTMLRLPPRPTPGDSNGD
ncbi:hypothetical protein [Deinococcus kurensis]|uniref:hypothetical protein n=1 Tax=Deinococcus kurensis TaxID=2662757 RepID=UPI0012D32F4D|nr:hypothetical protein [Deinococcus kurensis]